MKKKNLKGDTLLREIENILNNYEERNMMAENAKKLASPDAVSKIVDLILK